jgi:NAD(P)H-dependent FMN reductase
MQLSLDTSATSPASTTSDLPSAVLLSSAADPGAPAGVLLVRLAGLLAAEGVRVRLIRLADLPTAGLLGRRLSTRVESALNAVTTADLVVVGTRVASSSPPAALSAFLTLLPPDALAGSKAIVAAQPSARTPLLGVDHVLRTALDSLAADVLPTALVASTEAEAWSDALEPRLRRAVDEALAALNASAATPARSKPLPAMAG